MCLPLHPIQSLNKHMVFIGHWIDKLRLKTFKYKEFSFTWGSPDGNFVLRERYRQLSMALCGLTAWHS